MLIYPFSFIKVPVTKNSQNFFNDYIHKIFLNYYSIEIFKLFQNTCEEHKHTKYQKIKLLNCLYIYIIYIYIYYIYIITIIWEHGSILTASLLMTSLGTSIGLLSHISHFPAVIFFLFFQRPRNFLFQDLPPTVFMNL